MLSSFLKPYAGRCGLYLQISGGVDPQPQPQTAKLTYVNAVATVRDSVASVLVEQSYQNSFNEAAVDAVYIFPLYEGAAVCDFEVEIDGRKARGEVKEKEEAKKDFQKAVDEGKLASLLESHSADVFQTSIGNIPAGKVVTIHLRYISELKGDAQADQLRLVLPTTIAPRYNSGSIPHPAEAGSQPAGTLLNISVRCEMTYPILSVKSPSHSMEISLGGDDESQPRDPCKAGAGFISDTFLNGDFVFLVKAKGVDEPHCVAEPHPTEGTNALALTLSPRFALTEIRTSELVFIIDRSGSMQGRQIEQAKTALQLFLRSIPHGHFFNIVSFGSTHTSLFPTSYEYTEENLGLALRAVGDMQADMGGTEIASALSTVLKNRNKKMPTQIFVLTDGEVTNVLEVIKQIESAVNDAQERKEPFVRVFSLGVGDAVSHHLVEGLSRAGQGFAQFVLSNERMEEKVVKMLKAALIPPITNLRISWVEAKSVDDDFEIINPSTEATTVSSEKESQPTVINLFNPNPIASKSPPPLSIPDLKRDVQTAPFQIPPLFPGFRFVTYAILAPTIQIPSKVLLTGSTPDGPVELEVPVVRLSSSGDTPMVHTLAARKLIQDLEEGRSWIGPFLEKKGFVAVPDSMIKQEVVRLGVHYHLASKHTSWIVVDEETKVERKIDVSDIVAQHWRMSPGRMRKRVACLAAYAPSPPPPAAAAATSWGAAEPRVVPLASLPPPRPPPASCRAAKPFTESSKADLLSAIRSSGGSCKSGAGFSTVPKATYMSGYGASNVTFGSVERGYQDPADDIGSLLRFSLSCRGGSDSENDEDSEEDDVEYEDVADEVAMDSEPLQLSSAMAPMFGGSGAPGGAVAPALPCAPPSLQSAPKPSSDPHALLHLITAEQSFAGSWPKSDRLIQILGLTAEAVSEGLASLKADIPRNIDDNLFSTVYMTSVVLTYLKARMSALQSSSVLIEEKAQKFIARTLDQLFPGEGGKSPTLWVGTLEKPQTVEEAIQLVVDNILSNMKS
ncbi:uncharacterized protein SPPG_05035 [Spizellomyces punctatus DAOM BR117]|uniref:VWFA domain-containing protein n=1 Tax=Spizellomyces punctatus (strain DAOM BR117) TaxID=645134 RepID=A0A0L0HFH1_SPIPD|nr:uncharacterized protein SPPG_05035 [Spizellomyces punctatus DAOM BR117]KNC99654.1 hypothetical protein SPPG_05035 [Spizellomyces punctatus DAOM BR117]|eukprot:XP_016607694.1 hypothetical protein SPPG_05035 [Spizellomyces punctatus DAOM BR117]